MINILTECYRNCPVFVVLVYVALVLKSCCSNVLLWFRNSRDIYQ